MDPPTSKSHLTKPLNDFDGYHFAWVHAFHSTNRHADYPCHCTYGSSDLITLVIFKIIIVRRSCPTMNCN